jgi:DNA-binding protein H-NS
MPAKSLVSVKKEIAALQKLAERLEKKNKAPAIKTIKALMAKHGVTVADLTGGTRSSAAKATKRKAVAAKYQDPESGKTWSGRGRTPLWISAAETAGKSRDDFLIK